MPGETDQPPPLEALVRGLGPASLVLLLFYLLVVVAGQSDVQLIHPETVISFKDFEGLDVPSGSLLLPLLALEVPLFWFYALGPPVVLGIQAYLASRLDEIEPMPVARWLALYLPLALLLAMLWRFAPYDAARPPGGEVGVVSRSLSGYHGAILAAATVVLAAAVLRDLSPAIPEALGRVLGGAPVGRALARAVRCRRWHRRLLAFGRLGILLVAAAMIWWGLDLTADATEPARTPRLDPLGRLAHWSGLALLLGWAGVEIRWSRRLLAPQHDGANRSGAGRRKEVWTMHALGIAVLLISASFAIPGLRLPLDLAGARLVREEPNDVLLAAMIVADRLIGSGNLRTVRTEALQEFGKGYDFSDWRFQGASFQDAHMPLIRLNGARLDGANLIRADLTHALLDGAKLARARLQDAVLVGANRRPDRDRSVRVAAAGEQPAQGTPTGLPGGQPASESPCNPDGALDLRGARLQGADLTNADFSHACLQQVEMDATTTLKETDLTGSDLTKAILANASLSKTNLTETRLFDADLTKAIFNETILLKTNFCAANLSSVDLTNAKIEDPAQISFRHANLMDAKLPKLLKGADFEGAYIKGLELVGERVECPRVPAHGKDDCPDLTSSNFANALQDAQKFGEARSKVIGEIEAKLEDASVDEIEACKPK